MIVNEPNIVIWANRCYNLSHKVREATMANRTNPDARQNQGNSQNRRHPSGPEDDVGLHLDVEA